MYNVMTDARIKVTAVAQTMGDMKASWLTCQTLLDFSGEVGHTRNTKLKYSGDLCTSVFQASGKQQPDKYHQTVHKEVQEAGSTRLTIDI